MEKLEPKIPLEGDKKEPTFPVSRAERRRIQRKLRELPTEQHEAWMKKNGYSFRK